MGYADEILADSPLIYYKFDEAAGSATVADSSGNGVTGTVQGATLGVAPLITTGTAMAFPASSARVSLTANLPGDDLTYELWFKTTATSGNLFSFTASARGVSADMRSGGAVRVLVVRSSTTEFVTTGGYNDGQRHHLVVTRVRSTGAVVVYIDGVVAASGTASNESLAVTNASVYIGAGNNSAVATVDEFAQYGTALSTARIQAHYEAGTATVTPTVTLDGIAAVASADFAVNVPIGATVDGIGPVASAAVALVLPIEATLDGAAPVAQANVTLAEDDSATLAGVAPVATADLVLDVSEMADIDSGNAAGGLDLGGLAVVTWEPPVEPVPVTAPTMATYDTALAYEHTGVMGLTQPLFTVQAATRPRPRHRVVIGGKDFTYFRGRAIPAPSYRLLEPLRYGAASIEIHSVYPAFGEKPGVGELAPLGKHKRVIIQRVDDAGNVVATVYRGRVIGHEIDGNTIRVECNGEALAPASARYRPPPLFRLDRDLGRMIYDDMRDLGLPFEPNFGPVTGIRMRTFGGMYYDQHIAEVLAKSWNRAGNQWTVMPGDDGVYRMTRKDTTTIHGTIYIDDAQITASLRRDHTEEPNRVFVNAVAPNGERISGARFPGMLEGEPSPYPLTSGAPFGVGTTDADVDEPNGITIMTQRLVTIDKLDERDRDPDNPGVYTQAVAEAVRDLQRDAELPGTGDMDPATWDAMYDLGITGYTAAWSRIMPLAADPRTKPYRLSASGAMLGTNPAYDPSVMPVDVTYDMGQVSKPQAREFAGAEVDAGQDENYVGTITIRTGAIIRGNHTPGTPITAADLMPDHEMQPGHNYRLPYFAGGLTVHVASVEHGGGEDGTERQVTIAVDTRARDAMKVWQIIARNRESRSSPERAWLNEHFASRTRHDTIQPWDAVGGQIDRQVLKGLEWNVFPMIAGEAGTISRLFIETTPATEFAIAIFGREVTPRRLENMIGDPLTPAGTKKWTETAVFDRLDRDHWILYVGGIDEQPAGYFPGVKDNGAAPAWMTPRTAPTGRWSDDATFSYRSGGGLVLWVAIFPEIDTEIPAGRIARVQLETGI